MEDILVGEDIDVAVALDYIRIDVQKLNPKEDEFIVIRYDKDKITAEQMAHIHNSVIKAFQRGVITLPFDINIEKMSHEELIDLINGLQRLIAELIGNEDKNN